VSFLGGRVLAGSGGGGVCVSLRKNGESVLKVFLTFLPTTLDAKWNELHAKYLILHHISGYYIDCNFLINTLIDYKLHIGKC
jgi:hypothetical protein